MDSLIMLLPSILNLNKDSKTFVMNDIKTIVNVVISILFFHSTNRVYIENLGEILNDLIRISIIGNDKNYPTVACNKEFLNIVKRFNDIQAKQEDNTKKDTERVYETPPVNTDVSTPIACSDFK